MNDKEYFVIANSFAAPFFSDSSEEYVKGSTPKITMEIFIKNYKHPFGLYAAALYENADSYHKKKKYLVRYLSNRARGIDLNPKDGVITEDYS